MPTRGDVRVNDKTHPLGTPPDEIWDFEIWDGQQWQAASTARDILTAIGSLKELIEEH